MFKNVIIWFTGRTEYESGEFEVTLYVENDYGRSEEISKSVLLIGNEDDYYNEELGITISSLYTIDNSYIGADLVTDLYYKKFVDYEVYEVYKISYTYNDEPTINTYDKYQSTYKDSLIFTVTFDETEERNALMEEYGISDTHALLEDGILHAFTSDFEYIDEIKYSYSNFEDYFLNDGYIYIVLGINKNIYELDDSQEDNSIDSNSTSNDLISDEDAAIDENVNMDNPQTGIAEISALFVLVVVSALILFLKILKRKNIIKNN